MRKSSKQRPAADPSWSCYPRTILAFHSGRTWTIDLRRALRAADRRRLKEVGLDRGFAVLTACNPRGARASDLDNARRTHRLRALIALHEVDCLPVDGRSPDGTHVEPGFAARLPMPSARRIARYFDQTAFFWFDGTRFSVEPVDDRYARIALPLRAKTGRGK